MPTDKEDAIHSKRKAARLPVRVQKHHPGMVFLTRSYLVWHLSAVDHSDAAVAPSAAFV